MCGFTNAKVGDDSVSISMGYRGNSMYINDNRYSGCSKENREAIAEYFTCKTKEELVDIIIQFFENGDEG